MTALRAVAAYLPDRRTPIEDLAERLELTPMQVKMFRRYHGLANVALDPDHSLLELLLAATERLDGLRGHERQVRHVLYARAFPVVEPYPRNALRDLCRALGLDQAQAFTVTHQSCATGLLAIDIAGRLLAAGPEAAVSGAAVSGSAGSGAAVSGAAAAPDEPLALVLAGEKAFTLDSQRLPGTAVFGEGASACLVGRDGPSDRVLAYACDLRGDFDGEPAEVAIGFQREYRTLLSNVLRAAVDRAGLSFDEISLILPHNVNIVSWQRVCRAIGFPIDRVVLDNVAELGHVYCADAFINYQTARERGLLKPGDRYLVAATGAGLGATFSAMVLEH